MIDTHCHLWFDHFNKDRDEVIQKALDAGVHTMVQVGCDEPTSRKAVQLAEDHDFMFATVGLHPNDHKRWYNGEALVWMRELINRSDKVVAVGETGIDYYRSADYAEIQQEMLKGQCELAQQHDLPVIIHNRHTKRPEKTEGGLNPAEADCLKVLDEVGMQADKVIFHCFSGGIPMAKEIIKRGWIISFSGVVTYSSADELREVAKMLPAEQLVVETDCPFLPPQKYRGERNEPSFVVETALLVAQTRGDDPKAFEEQTDANARRVFGIG